MVVENGLLVITLVENVVNVVWLKIHNGNYAKYNNTWNSRFIVMSDGPRLTLL